MKNGMKKILAAMLAAAMTAIMLLVPAGAESIAKTAKSRKSGESFSIKLGDGTEHDYKVKLTKGGDLKINLTSACEGTCFWVYDSNGNSLSYSKSASKAESGSFSYSYSTGSDFCRWNDTLEKFKGTVVFKDLDKGTYYVRIKRERHYYDDYSGQGKATVKFTFPGEAAEEKTDPSLSVTVKKDETLSLGTISAESEVTWSSSDKAVASVDQSGKVTAKKTGSATVTAKTGKTALTIVVVVA